MMGLDPSITFFIAALVFFILAIGVLIVLWIATPFSIFGVKGLIAKLAEEQATTNRLLKELISSLKSGSGPGGPRGQGYVLT
jgi:hypothetical protein